MNTVMRFSGSTQHFEQGIQSCQHSGKSFSIGRDSLHLLPNAVKNLISGRIPSVASDKHEAKQKENTFFFQLQGSGEC